MSRGGRKVARQRLGADAPAPEAYVFIKVPGEEVEGEELYEWEDDHGWCPYTPDVQQMLRDTVAAGSKQATVKFGRTEYKLDLERGVQVNSKTGFERRLRLGKDSCIRPQAEGEDPKEVTARSYVVAERAELAGERCSICMCDFDDEPSEAAGRLKNCGGKHYFHEPCILEQFKNKLICPVCSKEYGVVRGTMPVNGTMDISRYPPGEMPLAGHEDVGTIMVRYNFPDGVQGPEHPQPGEQYYGTSRDAYLPDTAEGRKILELLIKAFKSRLTFTVGTSMTTGATDSVVWAGIHHKTQTHGGPWGFPDDTYLERVRSELAAFHVQCD